MTTDTWPANVKALFIVAYRLPPPFPTNGFWRPIALAASFKDACQIVSQYQRTAWEEAEFAVASFEQGYAS